MSGETPEECVIREVKEELGIELKKGEGIIVSSVRRDDHHDFYDIWLYRKDIKLSEITIDNVEVIDVKWVSIETFISMFNNNQIMPTLGNFPDIYTQYIAP